MPVGGPSFSSVRKARAALKERANELITLYIDGMKKALDAGDFETFQKGMANIVAHIPPDDDEGGTGQTVFAADVDKKQVQIDTGHKGPMIQIGVSIGGIAAPKQLPEAEVIEIKPDDPS